MDPWITQGIIVSVQTKCGLYTDKKDTVTNQDPTGDPNLKYDK